MPACTHGSESRLQIEDERTQKLAEHDQIVAQKQQVAARRKP